MHYNTGLLYLYGAFIFIYLGRRFYLCYRRENNYIAKLFGIAFFSIGINYFVNSIPSLFLIDEPAVWKIVAPIYVFFMGTGWLIMCYAIVYSRMKTKPSLGLNFLKILFLVILILTVMSYIIFPPRYFYIDGVLSWESSSSLIFFMFPIILIVSIYGIIFFFQEAKKAKDKTVKIRSFGLGMTMFLMLLTAFADFILLSIFKLHPIYSDLNYSIMLTILAITLIKSWGSSSPQLVKKIE